MQYPIIVKQTKFVSNSNPRLNNITIPCFPLLFGWPKTTFQRCSWCEDSCSGQKRASASWKTGRSVTWVRWFGAESKLCHNSHSLGTTIVSQGLFGLTSFLFGNGFFETHNALTSLWFYDAFSGKHLRLYKSLFSKKGLSCPSSERSSLSRHVGSGPVKSSQNYILKTKWIGPPKANISNISTKNKRLQVPFSMWLYGIFLKQHHSQQILWCFVTPTVPSTPTCGYSVAKAFRGACKAGTVGKWARA